MLIEPLKHMVTFWRAKWSAMKYYPICDDCVTGVGRECQNPECAYYGGAIPRKMSFPEHGVELAANHLPRNGQPNRQTVWRNVDHELPPPGKYWVCCEEHLGRRFIGEGHFNGELWVHPERYGFSGGSWFQVKYWTPFPEPPDE